MAPVFDTSNSSIPENLNQEEFDRGPFIWIPNIIYDMRLPPFEFVLYAVIKSLSTGETVVETSFSELSISSNISKCKVKECIKGLESKGLIRLIKRELIQPESIVNNLKCKIPQKIPTPISKLYICVWCEAETYTVHSHHYPIKKSDGGKETVKICANCHYEFHSFENSSLNISIVDVEGGDYVSM